MAGNGFVVNEEAFCLGRKKEAIFFLVGQMGYRLVGINQAASKLSGLFTIRRSLQGFFSLRSPKMNFLVPVQKSADLLFKDCSNKKVKAYLFYPRIHDFRGRVQEMNDVAASEER